MPGQPEVEHDQVGGTCAGHASEAAVPSPWTATS